MSFKASFIFISLSSLFLSSSVFAAAPKVVLIALDDIVIPVLYKPTPLLPNLDTVKQGYLDAINQARLQTQDCGVYGIQSPAPALTWSEKLYDASTMHSNDMAQANTFSHTGSGLQSDIVAQINHPNVGSTIQERIEHTGYNWSQYGENISAGYSSVEDIMIGWLNSDRHCVNIMNPNFKNVAMSLVTKEGSQYHYYWTQDFGTQQ